MSTPENVDTFLDILGNETRRKILQILADEPQYLLQLAKELDVSQQAVLKHLSILQKFGFITSFEEESVLAAPPRKYYELERSAYLTVGISSDNVDYNIWDIPKKEKTVPQSFSTEIDKLDSKAKSLEKVTDIDEALDQADNFVRALNNRIEELEQFKCELLRLKQRAQKIAHVKIRESSDNLLERKILYRVLGTARSFNIDNMSESFNIREKEIEQAIKELQKRLDFFQRKEFLF
ncbi:MAG: helix-turn-helix domain-containing protein [Candidatus Bathyarchaeia archaeon]